MRFELNCSLTASKSKTTAVWVGVPICPVPSTPISPASVCWRTEPTCPVADTPLIFSVIFGSRDGVLVVPTTPERDTVFDMVTEPA